MFLAFVVGYTEGRIWKMSKKILALDLDGTLTNSKKEITPRTRKALTEMMKRGHTVVLASGRPTPGVLRVARSIDLQKYDGYVLSYNGGQVTRCSTGEVLHAQYLPEKIVPEIFSLADELGIGMMTYNKQGIVANMHNDEFMELEAFINHMDMVHYQNPMGQITEPVNKCLGTAPVETALEYVKIFQEKFRGYISVGRSEPFYIELMPLGIDKAVSLGRLSAMVGLGRENVIACGDGFNDISMVEYAGLGVAMANAQDELKEAADYVTFSNDEDGVAHVIEKYILGN